MILTCDVETSGLDPASDAVCELAGVPLIREMDEINATNIWHIHPGFSTTVAPGRRVPPQARAVHHLSDEDLRCAPKLPHAMADMFMALDKRGERIECVAAHNSPFDQSFIGQYFDAATPWLDTCRCAMHLWPDAPSYSNQVLRYFIGIKCDPTGEPHRALYDATVTAHILKRMLADHTLGELLELQQQPVLQRTCRFGKHRGEAWSAIPRDYCRWLLRQDNPPFDDDVRHTAQHYLGG